MKKLLMSFILLACGFLSLTTVSAANTSQTGQITHLTTNNVDQYLNGSKPVIIDAYASWCGPCKKLAPIFQELNDEFGNHYSFVKINTDDQPSLSNRFNIKSLPTLIFIKDGHEVGRSVGYVNKMQITSMMKNYFGN